MQAAATDFTAVFRASPAPYLLLAWDAPVFTILDASDSYLRATLTDRTQIVGRGLFDVFTDDPENPAADGVANLQASLDKVLATRAPHEMRVQKYDVARPDGSGFDRRYWKPLNSPVFGADGEPNAILHYVEDVTAEPLFEQRISIREETLTLALDAAEIGSWDYDARADTLSWNARTYRIFGIAEDQPVSLDDFYRALHPDDVRATREAFVSALDPLRRETYDTEYRVIRRDTGDIRWVHAKGRGLFDDKGDCLRAIGTAIDVTERKHAEQRLRLLAREVDHRANNLMAVIQSTVTLSQAPDVKDLKAVIVGRVQAIARAHQLLAESRWEGADLRRLVEEELLAFSIGDAGRAKLRGPPVALPPATAQSVAMALHELTTNAAKYGALSRAEGVVAVTWSVAPDGELRIAWEEHGGPPVSPPTHHGLGSIILSRTFRNIRGECTLTWKPQGLLCEIRLPDRGPDATSATRVAAMIQES